MIRKIVIVGLTVLLITALTSAMEIRGITMPDTMTVGEEKLVLNGAGVRKKLIFDIYVIGLYLKKTTNNAMKIINADETMALRLKIVTHLITSERFRNATLKGFEQSTNGNTALIQNEVDLFLTAFSNEVKNQDLFLIQYRKDEGVYVYKNGQLETAVIGKGLLLKKALFGLWIGNRNEKHLQILAKVLLGN